MTDGHEYRVTHGVTGGARDRYEVSELTASDGFIVRLPDLERWQAYAIVAILEHPFQE